MNNLNPPFNDKRVRLAFNMGIDKRDVVELTLFGQGAPTISPIPPTHPFYAHDLEPGAADPAGARKLLAAAGHPNGISVPIIVPTGRPVRERLGVTLQQLAKPPGSICRCSGCRSAPTISEVSGKAPLYIDGYFARPTIDTSTYPFLHSSGSWNAKLWHYSDKAVDDALAAARLIRRPGRAEGALYRDAAGAGGGPVRVLRLLRQLRLRLLEEGQRGEDASHALVRPAHGDRGVNGPILPLSPRERAGVRVAPAEALTLTLSRRERGRT